MRSWWTVFDTRNLRKEWEKACVCAGLGKVETLKSAAGHRYTKYRGLNLHDLRRTAITDMSNNGVPEKTVQAISGHKDHSVFRRYNLVGKADVMNAVQVMARATTEYSDLDSDEEGRLTEHALYADQLTNKEFGSALRTLKRAHDLARSGQPKVQLLLKDAKKKAGLGQHKVQVPISEDSEGAENPRQ